MLALFALDVVSVGWMALVGAFIALEKMLPWKRIANRSVAVALAVIASGIAVAPGMAAGVGIQGTTATRATARRAQLEQAAQMNSRRRGHAAAADCVEWFWMPRGGIQTYSEKDKVRVLYCRLQREVRSSGIRSQASEEVDDVARVAVKHERVDVNHSIESGVFCIDLCCCLCQSFR